MPNLSRILDGINSGECADENLADLDAQCPRCESTMQVTQKSVILETTNRVHGTLEQGGVCGRRVAYPIDSVQRVTGLTVEQIRAARETDRCPGYSYASLREIIESCCVTGRVVRRGVLIQ